MSVSEEGKIWICVIGILCVTGLEAYALYLGINGTQLSIVVAAICSLVGVAFGLKLGELKTSSVDEEP